MKILEYKNQGFGDFENDFFDKVHMKNDMLT